MPVPAVQSYRAILRIAWPLMLTSASYTLMQFTDRLFLSWHDPVSIAASGPAGILNFTIATLFLGTVQFVSTLVAQNFGAGRPRECGRCGWQGIWLALGSYPLFLCLLPLGYWLLGGSGHDPAVIAAEYEFFGILSTGALFLFIHNALSGFFSGLGHTRIVLAANLAANLVNIPANYCLIFGKCGLPALGISGSALATVIANVVVCAVLLARFLSQKYAVAFGTRGAWRPDRALLLKLLRYGLPAGAQWLLDLSSFTAFVFIIGMNGTVEQMTGNILLTVNSLLFLPMLGLGTATSTMVGQSLGAGRRAAAMRHAYRALHLGWLFQALAAILLLGFPALVFELFRGDTMNAAIFAQVTAFGTAIIPIIVFYNLFDAASVVISGALRGAGDTLFPLVAGVVTAWLFFVPVTYIAVAILRHSIVYAFACLALYVVLLMLVLWLRFRAGGWRRRALIA